MSAIALPTTKCPIQPSHQAFELAPHDLQDLLPTPAIDRDRLLEQCLSNLDFALMLLSEFENSSQSRLDAFDAALAERNHAAIASKAHALRGVAGILAADTLMETCSKLESASKNADWGQTHDLTQQLHYEMQRTIDFIPIIRSMR